MVSNTRVTNGRRAFLSAFVSITLATGMVALPSGAWASQEVGSSSKPAVEQVQGATGASGTAGQPEVKQDAPKTDEPLDNAQSKTDSETDEFDVDGIGGDVGQDGSNAAGKDGASEVGKDGVLDVEDDAEEEENADLEGLPGESGMGTQAVPTGGVAQPSAADKQEQPASSVDTQALPSGVSALESAVVANGVYTISQQGATRLYLTGAGDSDVKAQGQSYAAVQRWRLTSLAGGLYRIDNVASGRTLQASAGNGGAVVSQGVWNGADAQKWRLCMTSVGAVLVSVNWDNKVLRFADGKLSVLSWDGASSNVSPFAFDFMVPVMGDEYFKMANEASGLNLGVTGSSSADDAHVEQGDVSLASDQLFRAVYDSQTGYYQVLTATAGKPLSVENASTQAGARVVQGGSANKLSQLWQIVRNADGSYSFFSALSGCALGMSNNANFEGDVAHVGETADVSRQRWRVALTSNPISAGMYTLVSSSNTSFALDAGSTNGSLRTSKISSAHTQQFVIERQSNGRYLIRNSSTGLYVARNSAGSLVQSKAGRSGYGYEWNVELKNGGFAITSPDGRAIDTFGGSLVGLAGVSDSASQRFLLNKTGAVRSCQIEEAKYGRNAIVTIIDDDGWWSSERKLSQLAIKYQLPITQAMVVNRVAPDLAKWQSLTNSGYIDVVSHTYSHPRIDDAGNPTWAYLDHELGDASEWLALNFGAESVGFVTPYNSRSSYELTYLLENGCFAVRSGYQGFGTLSPEWGTNAGQWLNLAMQNIYGKTTAAKKNAMVDQAVAGNNWLIEMWHAVGDEGWETVSLSDAESHLSHMKKLSSQGKLWVASFTEASKYLHEKQHCSVSATDGNNEVFVSLDRTDDFLPKSSFNAELTVKVEIPSSWKGAKVAGGSAARISVSGGKRYASFEMRPDTSVSLQRTY